MTCNVFFVILGTLDRRVCINVSVYFRDLTSWLNSVTSLVSSDELATDVSRAEALLERHQVTQHQVNTIYYFSSAVCRNSEWR